MKSAKKVEKYETPRILCRIPVFCPVRRPKKEQQYSVETSWGSGTITGRLGQSHRDLLDIIINDRIGKRKNEEGDVKILIDSAEIRRKMGWSRANYDQIERYVTDLMRAIVKIQSKDGRQSAMAGIITKAKTVVFGETPNRKGSKQSEKRQSVTEDDLQGGEYWEITLSAEWIALMESGRTVYDSRILQLKNGVSQAVARFMLSHSHDGRTNMNLITVLESVNADPRLVSRDLCRLKEESGKLKEIGINIDDNSQTVKLN